MVYTVRAVNSYNPRRLCSCSNPRLLGKSLASPYTSATIPDSFLRNIPTT